MRPLLLLRIALFKDGQLDYFSAFALAAVVAVLLLVGAWLWRLGLDWVGSAPPLRKLAGALLLALATAYTLACAWLGYWEARELWTLF